MSEKDFQRIYESLNKIEEKMDKTQVDINNINLDIATMKSDLNYHIRRTNIMEEMLSRSDIKTQLKFEESAADSKLTKERVEKLELPQKSLTLLLKVLGAASVVGGLIIIIQKLI